MERAKIPAAEELLEQLDVPGRVARVLKAAINDEDQAREDLMIRQDLCRCLAVVRDVRTQLDVQLRELEREVARDAWEAQATWGDIADAVGVSRQTAQQTYRDTRPHLRRRLSRRDNQSWPEEPTPQQ